MEKTNSISHADLKDAARVLCEHADWLEKEFEGKEEPLNVSIVCVVANEDTGNARSTVMGGAHDLATSLATAEDSPAWGRMLSLASIMAKARSGGGLGELLGL